MARQRCYWEEWDWESEEIETVETTGSSGTPTSGTSGTSATPEIVCEQFYRPKIDSFLMIPTSIIEIYYEE